MIEGEEADEKYRHTIAEQHANQFHFILLRDKQKAERKNEGAKDDSLAESGFELATVIILFISASFARLSLLTALLRISIFDACQRPTPSSSSTFCLFPFLAFVRACVL